MKRITIWSNDKDESFTVDVDSYRILSDAAEWTFEVKEDYKKVIFVNFNNCVAVRVIKE